MIEKIENPSIVGTSGHFTLSIFDSSSKTILYKTYGLLNSFTTLDYVRTGLMVTVA